MAKLTRSDTWFCFIASYAIATWSYWGFEIPENITPGLEPINVLLMAHALQMIFSFLILVFLFKVITPWVEWGLAKLLGTPKDGS